MGEIMADSKSTVTKNCKCCGKEMSVRLADHKRGWGKFCSKSCKAINQSNRTGIKGPDYRAAGMSAGQMLRGKYAASKFAIPDDDDTHWASSDALGQ